MAEPDAEAVPAQGSLILLVEDDVLIRFSTSELLRDHGYEVAECDSAEEALSLLSAGLQPSLIVTDVRMPGAIDGLGLLELVSGSRPALPVLVMSSHLPDHAPAAVPEFLAKPFLPSRLIETVRRLTADGG